MSLRFGRFWAAHTFLVLLSAAANAQPSATSVFKIEIKSEELILPGYYCQLDQYPNHQRFGTEDLRADGACTFHSVPYGDYRLTVLDEHSGVVHDDLVSVSQNGQPLVIQLPKGNQSRPPSGHVSVAHLQHPPSRKAFNAMLSAQHFSESGDYRHAAEELQKAIVLSPDYADAHWNLAVQYIRLGDFARSLEESRRGMQLEKPGAMQLSNLAYAQMQLKQYGEATETVRNALRLDAGYPPAHLMIGTMLAQDPRTLADAISHLELAARSLPSATRMLELARRELARQSAQNAQ